MLANEVVIRFRCQHNQLLISATPTTRTSTTYEFKLSRNSTQTAPSRSGVRSQQRGSFLNIGQFLELPVVLSLLTETFVIHDISVFIFSITSSHVISGASHNAHICFGLFQCETGLALTTSCLRARSAKPATWMVKCTRVQVTTRAFH